MTVSVVKVITALTLGLLNALGSQQAGKVYRIGYLTVGSRGPLEQLFEQALRERGWVTGGISSSPTATRRGDTAGSLTLRPS